MREDDAARKDNKKRPYDSSSYFKVALDREAKILRESSGYTTEIETNRLQKILDEMYESRRDDDKTNDKQISDYDERYKSALLQLLPLIERIANASEKTAANTNEVELN